MTQYQSAIHELAERLQGTDASLTTSISEILATALQELIEAELTATIGADHGERVPTRTAQRNGHCLSRCAGRRGHSRAGGCVRFGVEACLSYVM